jgi:hypothetical protein
MIGKMDKLDKKIQKGIIGNPGCSIRDAIRPFLLERSESVLRDRVRALKLRRLIRLQKTKKEVLCYPVEVVE